MMTTMTTMTTRTATMGLLLGIAATCITVSHDSFAAVPAANVSPAAQKQEVVARILEDGSGNNYWQSYLFDSAISFDIPADGWTALQTPSGITVASGLALSLGYYAKEQGLGDLEKIESANNNDRKANRPRVKAAVDDMKGKFSFSVRGQGVKYDSATTALFFRYLGFMGEFLGSRHWTPKGGSAAVTFVFSPTAKDASVSISPDNKTFTVTAPANDEPSEWDSKISKGLIRGGT